MSDSNDIAAYEAEKAAERHWRVHPVHGFRNGHCDCRKGRSCGTPGKHPRLKGYLQLATDSVLQMKIWAGHYPGTNWGVACGPSQLVVLDIDPRNGGDVTLAALERKNTRLPLTPWCLTGGGGDALYFQHPGEEWHVKSASNVLGAGIDVRGDDGQAVLPGSLHTSGKRYAWHPAAHPDEIPPAGLPGWVLELVAGECHREIEETEETEETDAISLPLPLSVAPTLEQAIADTLPSGPGLRHSHVFEFARALKAMPEYSRAKVSELREVVRRWHQAALPYIRSKEFDDTWGDFVHGWENVKFPRGQSALPELLARADASPDPPEAKDYAPGTRRLLKLCRELQRQAGAQPFYLACSTAANLIFGGDRKTASLRLKALVGYGVLSVARAHTTKKATRYRYHEGKP